MGNINLSEWLSVADDIAIKISDLQKENADLKCKVTQLGIGNDELVIRISDLQGENEKLLNCIDELHEGVLDEREKRLTVNDNSWYLMEENAELEEINAELEVVVKVLGNIIKGMKCNNCECNNDKAEFEEELRTLCAEFDEELSILKQQLCLGCYLKVTGRPKYGSNS